MLSLFALLGVFGLSAGLGASAFDYQELNHQANLVVDNQKLQPKLVSYDDENYTITLSIDELNNYSWSNLNSFLLGYESTDFINTYFSYLDDVYTNSNFDDSFTDYAYLEYSTGRYYIFFNYGYDDGFVESTPYKFTIYTDGGFLVFDEGAVWHLNSTVYNDIKEGIELDIQANQNNGFDGASVATDIVETLVGGIAGIASGLGAGVSALVSDIFINNGSLSVFGYIVVIFAGIALAIGLSRWVMNFLTSLGAKK